MRHASCVVRLDVSKYLLNICTYTEPHIGGCNARGCIVDEARSHKPQGRHNNYKTTGSNCSNTLESRVSLETAALEVCNSPSI